MEYTIKEIADHFQFKIDGQNEMLILRELASLEHAQSTDLSFLSKSIYRKKALKTKAGAVITSEIDAIWLREQGLQKSITLLIAINPYVAFAKIAQLFYPFKKHKPGIHSTAIIESGAKISKNVYIGPYCYIANNVTIESGACLLNSISIHENSFIGQNSYIYPHVSVYHNCKIGKNVIIHSGVVIGADGFGFAPDFSEISNEWVKIPQNGGVEIGDDVEIGANTTIDRGVMTNTIIENGCKIDNLVQIAHNVKIGQFTIISGESGIAGSTEVGSFCMIGGASNIAGHLKIADHTIISGWTGIMHSITEPGQHLTSIFPMMSHREWEKNAAILRSLTKMRTQIKILQKEIMNMKKLSDHHE